MRPRCLFLRASLATLASLTVTACSTTRTYPMHPETQGARVGELIPEVVREAEALGALAAKHDLRYGILTAAELQSAANRHRDESFRCYQQAFSKRPRLEGTVALRLIIGPDGSVAGSRVLEDTMEVRALTACLQERTGAWRFPPPQGGDVVFFDFSFPFRLIPGGHWLAIPEHERKEM